MEVNKLNTEVFKEKFGDWWRYMEPFVGSEKMFNIYKKLKEYSSKGIKILPIPENTFRAFKECPPDKLKVIIIAQDPYPGRYKDGIPQATGVALDCSNSKEGICQPSLIKFYDGIANEYGLEPKYMNNLSYLTEQGVLLLNRALTVGYGYERIGDHMGWWDDFFEYFLDIINQYFTGIPIVLLGKDAQYLQKWIFPLNNKMYFLEHPSKAAKENRNWDTKGTFQQINCSIFASNKQSICWGYDYYKTELPF